MIIEKKGNIFTTKCQTIVNTINCVGVMGAGIAFEFRLRYEEMFAKYQELCNQKKLDIGILWIYNAKDKMILNFPTKYDWKFPSQKEYLHKGLKKFCDTYKQKGIKSIAFPLLGAQMGGISQAESLSIMRQYLEQCDDLEVEIWHFDPTAEDDLYNDFKDIFSALDDETIKKESKIRIDIAKIRQGIENPKINSISGLLNIKGVGDKTLEKLFQYIKNRDKFRDKNLFDD